MGNIQDKIGLGESTSTQYLSFFQQSGLLEMHRAVDLLSKK
ncbi:hypothetical protein [Bacillus cihuensis]